MSAEEREKVERKAALDKARKVKEACADELISKANVVGVGIGLRQEEGAPAGRVVLMVMVTHKVPLAELAPDDVVPSEIQGVPVRVQAVGRLRAQG